MPGLPLLSSFESEYRLQGSARATSKRNT
jgi:hypothetical protein